MSRTRAASGLGLVAALLCGCGSVSQSRYTACQSQNRALSEQVNAQLAEIENVKIHARHVEDQLIKAEQELARANERVGHGKLGQTPVPAGLSTRLLDLAERHPALQYDPATGVCKFDVDLMFDSGQAELKPRGDRVLREFAEIFQSPDARGMKIMIVGHTDDKAVKGREVRERYPNNWHLSAGRALAVADRLRESGIPEQQMGIAGFGQYQPLASNHTSDDRQRNRRVEIFVLGPDTPLVGWVDTPSRLYR